MASTNVLNETLAKALAEGDPNRIADALRKYGIGEHLSPQKYTWVGSANATAVNITSAAFAARITPGSATPTLPQTQSVLPAALAVATLRVTTGPSGAVGPYVVTDAGGSANLGAGPGAIATALLSDDGTTLTFPAAVGGFVIEYIPRSRVDVNSLFENS